MTLDLDELTQGWECPSGELRARVVVGRDGEELLQIRLDLGLMQMFMQGRPDGGRCHGFDSTREYIEHEMRVGGSDLVREDWQELQRELQQINYRRLAYAALVEDRLEASDHGKARQYITGALADITACLGCMNLLDDQGLDLGSAASLQPTLIFDRARLMSQLRVVEGRFEEAIESAEAGAAKLEELLTELGYDEELRDEDPGVRYLRETGRQLRLEYGVTQTLRERLEEALEHEDFESAAEIRDELRRRENPAPARDENAG